MSLTRPFFFFFTCKIIAHDKVQEEEDLNTQGTFGECVECDGPTEAICSGSRTHLSS